MAITLTSNPPTVLQKLALGVASATLTFTTDSAAPIQTTVTATAGGSNMTMSTGVGMYQGGFLSIEGAASDGVSPWVNTLGSSNTNFSSASQSVGTGVPNVRTTVTNAQAYFYQRIETRYRAKKVTLTVSNGDVYVWDTTLLDDQAKYTPSGGSTTTLTSRGILNRSNCIGIHPNLLPANSSFSLKCDYDYHG